MNDAAFQADIREIVVDEVFPHAPETLWKTLTNGELMGRWLMAPAKNDVAYEKMGEGWKKVVAKVVAISGEALGEGVKT